MQVAGHLSTQTGNPVLGAGGSGSFLYDHANYSAWLFLCHLDQYRLGFGGVHSPWSKPSTRQQQSDYAKILNGSCKFHDWPSFFDEKNLISIRPEEIEY
jgi:hypothetical protein